MKSQNNSKIKWYKEDERICPRSESGDTVTYQEEDNAEEISEDIKIVRIRRR